MASPRASDHAATQAALARLLQAALGKVLPDLNPSDPRSLERIGTLIAALVRRLAPIGSDQAGTFYTDVRHDAGIPGRARLIIADAPSVEQVRTSLKWATDPLVDGRSDLEPTLVKVRGVAEKLTLDPGRHTILDTSSADVKAIGWARVPEADCCYFCALLATRGAAYKDGSADSGGFKSHDHCRCHAEPVFTAYEPSAQVREWQAQYRDATKGVTGGGNNLLNAWRRSFEAPAAH